MTTEQKFNCIFCKDVFDSKEELQVHFRKHGDPQFKSKHVKSLVSKENDKGQSEMVSCDVCSQMFPTISKAITHKHKVHPDHDVKYFCPWCGKLFTMKHHYNIHVQNSHENDEQIDNKIFHCDCCDVDFFLPSAMIYHNKFFHRQDVDIPDIGSSKKLKLYLNQEVLQIYYCAFCGEEYENKVNLYKHITDDHSDENQCPEEVLRCPLCEAIFYHLDAYEIHLYFHTTEDLYSDRNDSIAAVCDFSLETVPPVIEKVEREGPEEDALSQDIDAEAVNAVGIENFLELAMGQADDSNPGKSKKKKHKKSKKSAITLDEFLNMNQDVFGEGLDFQGVEEVPTRVVAKQLKNNKKPTKSVTSVELEKLKSKGIMVMKVGASKRPVKIAPKKIVNKAPPHKELKTSSELLTKLMNQSNKEIKIVKKIVSNNLAEDIKNIAKEPCSSNEQALQQKTGESEAKEVTDNKIVNEIGSTNTKLNYSPIKGADEMPPPNIEECSSTTNCEKIDANVNIYKSEAMMQNEDNSGDDMNITSTNSSDINKAFEQNSSLEINISKLDDDNVESSCFEENKNCKNQTDSVEREFDSEIVNKNKITDANNIEDSNNVDCIQNSIEKNNAHINTSPVVSSLSTLKHLSHLTIKPVIQNKNTPLRITSNEMPETENGKLQAGYNDEAHDVVSTHNETKSMITKSIADKDPTIDALKILSKNITVKSLTQKSTDECSSDEDDNNEIDRVIQKPTNAIKLKDVTTKNLTIKKVKTDNYENTSVNIGSNSLKSSNTNVDSLQNSATKTNTDILKRLPNIITKTLTAKKNAQPDYVKQINACTKTVETNHKEQEVIEISDIDDSDDERDNSFKQPESKDAGVEPLKNLSKHITVKSLNQSTSSVKKTIKEEYIDEDHQEDLSNFDDGAPTNTKVCGLKLSSTNMVLKNALKNLGKNITVKSRNSSPSQSFKSQDQNSQVYYTDVNDDDGCDSDTEIGKVKITEIDDMNNSHNENFNNSDNYDEGLTDNDPIIESPHDSGSEQDEKYEKEFDFESEIKASTVQKSNPEVNTDKNAICLNNLSKNITIKTFSKNIDMQEKPKPSHVQESVKIAKNQTNQTPIKFHKQIIKEPSNENNSSNKNIKNICKSVDHSSNESLNQNVSVNKEVTVKTFQTKTVIQEITTTVTKTIKTVNQTVKQEMRDSSQINIPVLPQKVIGMRPSTSKNLQGVVVRHTTPINVKASNVVPQIRPSGNMVRPTKQIVPMRPTRPNIPRMQQNIKPQVPKSSPNKQVIGRPLKFSPNVMTSASKRPNAEDMNGPFSCFKKPKESLIPVSEIPPYSGDDTIQVNAASHTTTSNYMSTSKVIKGNNVMTTTQMKSEVSSMQQLSRQNTTTGIKMNAHIKQTQVQEKSESSAMKQTTLDAIEKLQKQGLLIKKPRMEENVNSESNYADDNADYSSSDEHHE